MVDPIRSSGWLEMEEETVLTRRSDCRQNNLLYITWTDTKRGAANDRALWNNAGGRRTDEGRLKTKLTVFGTWTRRARGSPLSQSHGHYWNARLRTRKGGLALNREPSIWHPFLAPSPAVYLPLFGSDVLQWNLDHRGLSVRSPWLA
jgi:hypothetical protein